MIRQLLFPGKKPKEIIQDGDDDDIDTDPDSGKKTDDGDVKGWYDGHPEIGKMQKDIFDDIFDTTDDGVTDEDDPEPIVPKPQDFEVKLFPSNFKKHNIPAFSSYHSNLPDFKRCRQKKQN